MARSFDEFGYTPPLTIRFNVLGDIFAASAAALIVRPCRLTSSLTMLPASVRLLDALMVPILSVIRAP